MKVKFIIYLISFILVAVLVVLGCNFLNKKKVDEIQDSRRYQDCFKVQKQDCIDVNMACKESKKQKSECEKKYNECIEKAEKKCAERSK